MDKSILKNFAIESRQDLIEKISNKIKTYYVDEEFEKEQRGDIYLLSNEKHSLNLSKEQYDKRNLLIKRIGELSLEQVIEEAAYTWFNRIIAIRYMELNDMLPLTKNNSSLGIRVLSSNDNTPNPEILRFTNISNPELDIELNKEQYIGFTNDNDKFSYILLLVCKKLAKVIPQVFGGTTDYIDILIPDNLLNDTGFVSKIINEVSIKNFNEVEIIGWLYQYYNQTEKDKVISAKRAYKVNEIPYATQLFTPDWIVKYMVENSLGRYWIEHNNTNTIYPGDNIFPTLSILDNWKYFIKQNLKQQSNTLLPTDITFIDPCCGSGHILVYAFEILHQIYESVGYNKNDISSLILQNNIYGLDIDDRAGQLAVLAVLLKAREYDKNIFNKEVTHNMHIMSLQESKTLNQEIMNYLKEKMIELGSSNLNSLIDYIYDVFINSKEIGSLLIVENKEYDLLLEKIKEIKSGKLNIFDFRNLDRIDTYFIPLIKQAKILSNKYDIVVTNPPYLSSSMMSANIKTYVNDNYKSVKSDLFSVFVIRNSIFGKKESYLGYMTPNVWMFITSYEELRKHIINNLSITSLIQLAKGSFFQEATVDICTFILKNQKISSSGTFYRLENFKGGMNIQKEKFLEAINTQDCDYVYNKDCNDFDKIPGLPIAYWVSNQMLDVFDKAVLMKEKGHSFQGIITGDNSYFLRFWYEPKRENLKIGLKNVEKDMYNKVWVPYNKGGNFRRWYGNNEYVLRWINCGKSLTRARNENVDYYFKEGVTWSFLTSGKFSCRYFPNGYLWDVAGSSIFSYANSSNEYICALMNSVISQNVFDIINPTLNFQVMNIIALPYIENHQEEIIKILSIKCIKISKFDWDSFETSWDFKNHPLIEFKSSLYSGLGDEDSDDIFLKHKINSYGVSVIIEKDKPISALLESSFRNWSNFTEQQFNQLKSNEEELNRIFIDIYGLQDELTPEVEDKDVTIRKADRIRDIKSLISYAVGCMFGRYSLDEEGLAYAGGNFDESKYKTFSVDSDNIIPITDEGYFNDDIVTRFKEFIEIVYGIETLNENLDYIAETLGKKNMESSDDTIRRYFISDFYKDHVKMYQKRPIYWLFDSGNKNGFKCLIYMHRYSKDLVATIRTKYIPNVQSTYEKLLSDIDYKLTTDLSLSDKKLCEKQKSALNNKIQEVKEYYEKIANVANKMIDIDLDDGVVVNYAKFVYENPKTNNEESILAKI